MIIYTIVYFRYTLKKIAVLKQLCAIIFILLLTVSYAYVERNHETLLKRLGKKNVTYLIYLYYT